MVVPDQPARDLTRIRDLGHSIYFPWRNELHDLLMNFGGDIGDREFPDTVIHDTSCREQHGPVDRLIGEWMRERPQEIESRGLYSLEWRVVAAGCREISDQAGIVELEGSSRGRRGCDGLAEIAGNMGFL